MIISRTPFRISFFGGGTDYPAWFKEHGGAVLGTSINKYCYISVRYLPPFFEHSYRISYSKIEHAKCADDIEHPAVRECIKYLNIEQGLEIHHDADLPARSGLGSSSSFAVGLLHSLYAFKGQMPTKKQLATDAICIEQERIRENVGNQDQVHASFGGFNHILFHPNNDLVVTPITIDGAKRKLLNDSLLLFFTGISRFSSDVAAEQIEKTPAKKKELLEIGAKVNEAVRILNGNIDGMDDFGRLLHETWQLKRSLTAKISNDMIDAIYDKGMKSGALGGKLLGAGGGGCILFFCQPDRRKEVIKALCPLLHVPFSFEDQGSQILFYQNDDL